MKKLLLFLALAAAGLQGRAEDLYLVGNALSIGYNINNAFRATVMAETSTNVYEWTGYFKASGEFKILTNKDSWDYGYNPTSSPVTLSDSESDVQARSAGEDNKWKVSADGVYKITINTSTMKIKAEAASLTVPTLTEGYYQIGTANDLVNFANAINKGLIGPNVKAKLTADIDMTDRTDFTPICCANAIKFTGEFDGQFHAITNLAVDYGTTFGYTGLFGYATDGAEVKNLIVGSGCSFKGVAKIAGVIGSAEGGGTVTLTNVINMAYVKANGNDNANAAGLVGCGSDNTVIVATNCANTGEIHGQDGQCAAFAGWTVDSGGDSPTKTTFTNCWNSGDIYNMDSNKSLYRNPDKVTETNCYDVNGADFYTQGIKKARTTLASGELCFLLNGVSGGTDWYQTLTSDAFPFPFSTHRTVYQYVSSWFSNLVITGSPLTATISSANDLMEFSRIVNNGNSVNAELTNDIDMDGITDYTPIGVDAHRFSSTFDGKGFRIKNLKIETDTKEQGLFSVCAGGATIKNLVIDSSCSVTCNNSSNYGAAAFVAVCNGSGTLTFENCGNEADVYGAKSNNGAFLGFNHSNGVTISLTNCYNTGKISGGYDNCAIIGWNGDNTFTMTNCYNIGTVENYNGDKNTWARSGGTKNVNNCYSKNVTGTDYNFSDKLVMITDAQKTSGELCYLLNGNTCYGVNWTQTLGTDTYPIPFNTHGIVNKISAAGYTTQYIPSTDVTIPDGVEAYAGVINGDWLSLRAISGSISKEDAVVLKGEEGYYSFVPTTDISRASSNYLKGSDGSVEGDGSSIYALANLGDPAVVGFYLVNDGVTVPAGKAYLNTDAGVKGFTFVFDDDATGIESLTPALSEGEGAIYNVAGQRVSRMQKGINIVNGKKVLY